MIERWVCPFCNFSQMIDEESKQIDWIILNFDGQPEQAKYETQAYACTNPKCRQISLTFNLYGFVYRHGFGSQGRLLTQRILPRSSSKPQPEYIPQALREDYDEACAIRDLSPKAAATLVRRCLQGMIRNFCKIEDQRTLDGEIRALRKLVDEGKAPSGVTEESVDAIDHVRRIGNIGAHMEKDIDLIIDVDPNEAQVLIELVEMLFDEWYVARHQRQERLGRIKVMAEEKNDAKKGQVAVLSGEQGGASAGGTDQ